MKAYTVELEAELNQLKEENAQLKHALVLTLFGSKRVFFCGRILIAKVSFVFQQGELERKRKQQVKNKASLSDMSLLFLERMCCAW